MIKRGCGSEEKPTRSAADGKENLTLNPYLKNYLNVDNNIKTVKNRLCPYQLVHEGDQFLTEKPQVSILFNTILNLAILSV